MFELITTRQMYEADRLTIASGIAGIELMENAGAAVFSQISDRFPQARHVCVLCGPGNNGGDGFVVARLVQQAGKNVDVFSLVAKEALGGDAALAAEGYAGKIVQSMPTDFDKYDLVIDGLFGAGLARDIDGEAAVCINLLNESDVKVVSIDVPSGVDGNTGAICGIAVKADVTVTFFRPKPGHFLLPGKTCCGDLVTTQIGINKDVIAKLEVETMRNSVGLWQHCFPQAHEDQHKYQRGHVLAITGGPGNTGAGRLAARGALRAGAGLVTVAAPQEAFSECAAQLTAIMLKGFVRSQDLAKILHDKRLNSVVVGPGLGQGTAAFEIVLAVLEAGCHVVLDADALTVFEAQPDFLFKQIKDGRKAYPGRIVVMTPHEGEFQRLFGHVTADCDSKLEKARKAAKIADCHMVLKGPDTIIAEPSGKAAINANGSAYLATAGSGDVLAGIISGLLGQQMPGFEAACAAVWLHGQVGRRFGPGLIAEDLPEMLPEVLGHLLDQKTISG